MGRKRQLYKAWRRQCFSYIVIWWGKNKVCVGLNHTWLQLSRTDYHFMIISLSSWGMHTSCISTRSWEQQIGKLSQHPFLLCQKNAINVATMISCLSSALEWALIFHDTLVDCCLKDSLERPKKGKQSTAQGWVPCLSLCLIYPAAAKWRTEHTSCSAPWQGLSQVLVCHRILPTKPEAVYLVFGFGSLAHTLASEKAYQQFQLRLFPALLNHTSMSLAQKMCLCFIKISMLCFPIPCAFSPHLARKEITV